MKHEDTCGARRISHYKQKDNLFFLLTYLLITIIIAIIVSNKSIEDNDVGSRIPYLFAALRMCNIVVASYLMVYDLNMECYLFNVNATMVCIKCMLITCL